MGIKIVEVTGKVEVGNALIISNHRTLLDPVVQAAFMDAFIIAKAEVGKLPVISQGAKMTGIIFVKREKLRSRLAAREMTKEVLLRGSNVLVYAEGTTGTSPTSDQFKVGTFVIAAEHDLAVVPVAIDYMQKKDYWFDQTMTQQIFGQIGRWRTHVKLRIGDPVYHTDAQLLMRDTKAMIDKNLLEMQKGWSQVFLEDQQKVKDS